MTLSVHEFLRRFLLHVLPTGFVRIRYFGLFAHRGRKELIPLCLKLLAVSVPTSSAPASPPSDPPIWNCPVCGGPMKVVERLTQRRSIMYLQRMPGSMQLHPRNKHG